MADRALVLGLDVILYLLDEGEDFFEGGLKEANGVVLEIEEDHQGLSLHLLPREIFLMFEQFLEAGLGDAVIFLAAPKPKQKWYWRVGKLHVMWSDGSSYDRIHEGKWIQCRQ